MDRSDLQRLSKDELIELVLLWAAQAEADVRTTVDTARLKGATPFQTILVTLA